MWAEEPKTGSWPHDMASIALAHRRPAYRQITFKRGTFGFSKPNPLSAQAELVAHGPVALDVNPSEVVE